MNHCSKHWSFSYFIVSRRQFTLYIFPSIHVVHISCTYFLKHSFYQVLGISFASEPGRVIFLYDDIFVRYLGVRSLADIRLPFIRKTKELQGSGNNMPFCQHRSVPKLLCETSQCSCKMPSYMSTEIFDFLFIF